MTFRAEGVTHKYYLSTLHRNAWRNRPVRVSLDARGTPIAVERIHPVTGELEVMERVKPQDIINSPYEQEIDLAQFEAQRARMLAPPSDEVTYEYFRYAATLVRIAVDSRGDRRGAEYVDRRTGEFVRDATWLSKIEFDWNAEAEEIDQADFERWHEQIKQAIEQNFHD